MDSRQRYNELKPVQATMMNFFSQLLRQGIPAEFSPATDTTLMTYINVGQDQGAVMANFLVQWNQDAQAWTVHRLSFQRAKGGLLQVHAPIETFTSLPDHRWFTLSLQAWLDHERREGIFAPPIPE